jgi:hypothetical protein
MEMRLIVPVTMLRTNRARAAGQATAIRAIPTLRRSNMRNTGRHVVAGRAESTDRAG